MEFNGYPILRKEKKKVIQITFKLHKGKYLLLSLVSLSISQYLPYNYYLRYQTGLSQLSPLNGILSWNRWGLGLPGTPIGVKMQRPSRSVTCLAALAALAARGPRGDLGPKSWVPCKLHVLK